MGAQHCFEIWTDHKNLQYFRKPQKLNRRQAHWQTELQEYDFLLVHKLGAQMKKANLLTHCTDFQAGREDNSDVILLMEDAFVQAIQVEPIASDLVKRIRDRSNLLDRAVQQALDKGTQGWTNQDGVVTWKDRVYVPKDAPLREEIIRLHHDSTLTGHPGRYKTHELITRNYWWPGIHRGHQEVRRRVWRMPEGQTHQAEPSQPAAPP